MEENKSPQGNNQPVPSPTNGEVPDTSLATPVPNLPKYKLVNRYSKFVDPVIRDPLVRGYFEILATILLVAFFILFAIRPTFNTVTELVKKSEELKTTDQALGQKIKNLVAAQAIYARYEDQIPLLEAAVPKKPEVETIVQDVEKLVTKNQVELTSLSVTGTGLTADAWKKNTGFSESKKAPLSFSVGIKGSFNNGEQFVADLVNLERLVNVSMVSYATSKESPGQLVINISGTGYFLP